MDSRELSPFSHSVILLTSPQLLKEFFSFLYIIFLCYDWLWKAVMSRMVQHSTLVSESGHPENNLLFSFPESENNSPQGCSHLCWEGEFGMKSVLATVQLFTWTAGHHCHHLLPPIFETLISSPTVHLM